ncbi:MAG: protein kinase, partial [Myxococcota bacterium]|nr:protein kinase [Myxococcota bacterium]
QTDLYAAGCLLYEMLEGGPPYVGDTMRQVLVAHLSEPPPRVTRVDLSSDLTDAWNALLERLMAKESTDRHPSASALATELAALGRLADTPGAVATSRSPSTDEGDQGAHQPATPSDTLTLAGPGVGPPGMDDTMASAPGLMGDVGTAETMAVGEATIDGPMDDPPAGAPSTCPACGHVSPPGATRCERCSAPFAPADTPQLAPGTRVGDGRYRVESKLDEGGMGSVYRATDTRLGDRPVALKVLHAELLSHATARERMEREALALSRIRHANVVGIFDCFDVDGRLAMVLEFIPGGDLLARVGDGPMPWRQSVEVMAQVLDGLAAIHAVGLVHRDIKTANVLMDGETPKVADLGIAHDETTRGLTRSGVNPGTPEYMSPEQIQGHVVDARSDLYACGVVLFELLTGTLPFTGESEFSVKKQHVDTPPDLSQLPEDVPPGLGVVIQTALAKAPDARFESAVAMARAVRAAERAPAPPVVPKSLQVSTAAPSDPAPVAQTTAPVVTHDRPTDVVTGAPPSRRPMRFVGVGVLVVALVALAVWFSGKQDREYQEALRKARAVDLEEEEDEEEREEEPCAHAQGWTGRWAITTVVRGDRKSAIGVNGFYDMVAAVEGCQVSLTLTKTGYTASGKRRMIDVAKRQSGTLTFQAHRRSGASAGGGRFVMRRANGKSPQDTALELALSDTDQLTGWWHYAGDSWDVAPFWGSLVAVEGHVDYVKHGTSESVGAASANFDTRLAKLRRQGGSAKLSFASPMEDGGTTGASAFVTRWAQWQSTGNYPDYAAAYHPDFEGTKRTSSGTERKMSRQRWLNDRRTMFAKGQTVHVRDVQVVSRRRGRVKV